jgi:hypothetical protein
MNYNPLVLVENVLNKLYDMLTPIVNGVLDKVNEQIDEHLVQANQQLLENEDAVLYS